MGTRADFYVGRGKNAEWLGSIAWDGYPNGIPKNILGPNTEVSFRSRVEHFIDFRKDGTFPKDGWPWPWDDSRLTDYSYAFDDGKVYLCCFGDKWIEATNADEIEKYLGENYEGKRKECIFPNMNSKKKVTLGERSGVIVIESR